MSEQKLLPAIPPEDYGGSQSDWMIGLQEKGLWNGEGWYGNIMITEDQWWELLEDCEGIDDEDDDDYIQSIDDEGDDWDPQTD